MSTAADPEWSLDRIRTVTLRVAAALVSVDPSSAERLEAAAGAEVGEAEALLLMRSALITSRASWETLDAGSLVAEARGAVAAGKRLAIGLD